MKEFRVTSPQSVPCFLQKRGLIIQGLSQFKFQIAIHIRLVTCHQERSKGPIYMFFFIYFFLLFIFYYYLIFYFCCCCFTYNVFIFFCFILFCGWGGGGSCSLFYFRQVARIHQDKYSPNPAIYQQIQDAYVDNTLQVISL